MIRCSRTLNLEFSNNLIGLSGMKVDTINGRTTFGGDGYDSSEGLPAEGTPYNLITEEGRITLLNFLNAIRDNVPGNRVISFFLGQGVGLFNASTGWTGNLNEIDVNGTSTGYWINMLVDNVTLTLEGECSFDPYVENPQQYCDDIGFSSNIEFPSIYIQGGNVPNYVGITLPPKEDGSKYIISDLNTSFHFADPDEYDLSVSQFDCNVTNLLGDQITNICWQDGTTIFFSHFDEENNEIIEYSGGVPFSSLYCGLDQSTLESFGLGDASSCWDTILSTQLKEISSGIGIEIQSIIPGYLKLKVT